MYCNGADLPEKNIGSGFSIHLLNIMQSFWRKILVLGLAAPRSSKAIKISNICKEFLFFSLCSFLPRLPLC